MRVIVVEDNILFCDYICNFLQNADYQTVKAYRLAQARQVIARSVREDDIVLADLRLPDGESTALLEWMREQGYTHPFIMMTNYEEIHTAVHAMKLGAEDYILKPLLEDKLLPALKKIRMADEAFAKVIYERKSAAFRELDRYIRLVAPTDMTVLILGNTGTGKEHLAGKIHKRSLRANKPYITVDCGSLSRELAASAFFGHVKGAFTGATDEKPGYFQEARGGTLFLDEVENLPVEIQQMLLRAMEERRYRPVGGREGRTSGWTCASLPPPTRTCRMPSRKNASGRTCYTGCRILQSPCPRCRIAWKTYSRWLIFSVSSLPDNWERRFRILTRRQKKYCWATAGRGMSVN